MNISKQAIEAGEKALTKFVNERGLKMVKCYPNLAAEEALAAALEHIIPKESDHAMFSVFDAAYGERDTHAWQNRVFRGLAAVLAHLRGEGKQAEASTLLVDPAIVKEASAFASAWIPDAHKSVTMPCRPNPLLPTTPASQEPNPDDVERVARAIAAAASPNNRSESWPKQWENEATAAIRAMNGQLWGIWAIPTDKRATPQREEWYDLTGADRFYTTDKSFCESIVANAAGLGMNTDWFRFEVRPYTAPREESADADEIADDICSRYFADMNPSHSACKKEIVKAIREAEKRGAGKAVEHGA